MQRAARRVDELDHVRGAIERQIRQPDRDLAALAPGVGLDLLAGRDLAVEE